jgi:hypothetical protein
MLLPDLLAGRELIWHEPIRPMERLKEQAAVADRSIEKCWWFRPVQIDFDLPQEGLDSLPESQQRIFHELKDAIIEQGHPHPGEPSEQSDMIIGFHSIPEGTEDFEKRVKEVEAKIYLASKRYSTNAFQQRYTVVISAPEDFTRMSKREMEHNMRTVLARVGALKVIVNSPETMGLFTMEGGLGTELKSDTDGFRKLRDRLVTHACAESSGGYDRVKGVIGREALSSSSVAEYMVRLFHKFGEWGYIYPPFAITEVASDRRARLANRMLGWSGQSESAGAAQEPLLVVPDKYQMGNASGAFLTTGSGRFNIDKTRLRMDDILVVSVIPKSGYQPRSEEQLSLDNFKRYALDDRLVPSIEFDEMAAALFRSPDVRVSRHPDGDGWKLDDNGDVVLKRARAFLHTHIAIESILPMKIWGKTAGSLVEYVPIDLEQYPYPFGCGVHMSFSCSTDVVHRSRGIQDVNSGVMMTFFDAANHGLHMIILTEPIPGTDKIPDDPYYPLYELMNPEKGSVRVTHELPMI